MKNINIKFIDSSNTIVYVCTAEKLLETSESVEALLAAHPAEIVIRLYAGDDYMGMSRNYYGKFSKNWLASLNLDSDEDESKDVRDRLEQITLTRQALDGRYTDEQRAAINQYLNDQYHDEDCLECRKSDRMFCYNNNLVQVFAVFGGIALQLMAFHDHEDDNIIFPLIIDGQCLSRDFTGDEGSAGGVAHLFYRAKKQKWCVVEIDRLQWLYTDELTMSRQEVTDRIVTEIEMGHNVLFPKPAGWA